MRPNRFSITMLVAGLLLFLLGAALVAVSFSFLWSAATLRNPALRHICYYSCQAADEQHFPIPNTECLVRSRVASTGSKEVRSAWFNYAEFGAQNPDWHSNPRNSACGLVETVTKPKDCLSRTVDKIGRGTDEQGEAISKILPWKNR